MLKITLSIDGMACGMCESHINDAIRNNFKVKKVSSSHTKGQTVIIAGENLDTDKLESVIKDTGYKLLSVDTEPYNKKFFFSK